MRESMELSSLPGSPAIYTDRNAKKGKPDISYGTDILLLKPLFSTTGQWRFRCMGGDKFYILIRGQGQAKETDARIVRGRPTKMPLLTNKNYSTPQIALNEA